MAQLKIKLMDADAEKHDLQEQLQVANKEMESLAADCEALCAQIKNQGEAELLQLHKDLETERTRNSFVNDQVEILRARALEAETKAADVERQLADEQEQRRILEAKLKDVEHDTVKSRLDAEAKIHDLEEQLEVMTKSKNQNKEYGAAMKSKLVELQNTVSVKFQELEQEKAMLEAALNQVQAQNEELAVRLENAEADLVEANAEVSSTRQELAKMGIEMDETQKEAEMLERQLQATDEARVGLERDHATLVQERKMRIEEFEDQLQKRRVQYDEEVAKLKVQIFDANERVQSEVARKQSEVDELSGYVQALLDGQDHVLAEICSACRAKAEPLLTSG